MLEHQGCGQLFFGGGGGGGGEGGGEALHTGVELGIVKKVVTIVFLLKSLQTVIASIIT